MWSPTEFGSLTLSQLEPRGPAPDVAGTLLGALEAGAAADAPYLVFHAGERRERLDARDALEGAARWARTLLDEGVRRGDRVPILLPTSIDFVCAFLGVQLAGAVPVPLATPLTFGRLDRYLKRLAVVVADADAHLLVTTARYRKAAQEVPALRASIRKVIEPADVGGAKGRLWPSLDAGDLALLQYTSGTSGDPKGVEVPHRSLVANAHAIADALAIEDDDVGVSWLPVFHDMGLIGGLCTPLVRPFEVHVLAPEAFVMRPRRWLQTLTEVRATVSPAPNFAYELCHARIDDLRGLDLGRWRAALNGAEMVHASTLHRFSERFSAVGFRGRAMTPVYGLAESTLAVSAPDPGAGPSVVGFDGTALEEGRAVRSESPRRRLLVSVGRPVAGTQVRIVKRRRVLPVDFVGEIQVRGPSLMRGYFRRPEASADCIEDGWLRTGDLGFVHRGELFVSGRAKDLIVQSGRNIYPDDVERVTREVDGVRGGAVAFSCADESRGTEALTVVAEVKERDPDAREALAKRIRGEVLAELGVRVDEVVLWPLGEIPRTTSGKVRRRACRTKWAQR